MPPKDSFKSKRDFSTIAFFLRAIFSVPNAGFVCWCDGHNTGFDFRPLHCKFKESEIKVRMITNFCGKIIFEVNGMKKLLSKRTRFLWVTQKKSINRSRWKAPWVVKTFVRVCTRRKLTLENGGLNMYMPYLSLDLDGNTYKCFHFKGTLDKLKFNYWKR